MIYFYNLYTIIMGTMPVKNRHTLCQNTPAYTGTDVPVTGLSHLLSFNLNYIFKYGWYIFTIYIQLLLAQCRSKTGTLCAGILRHTPAWVCRSHTGLSDLLSFSLNYIFIFRWYLFTIYIQLLWAQCLSETGTLCAKIHRHTLTLCASHKPASAIHFLLA